MLWVPTFINCIYPSSSTMINNNKVDTTTISDFLIDLICTEVVSQVNKTGPLLAHNVGCFMYKRKSKDTIWMVGSLSEFISPYLVIQFYYHHNEQRYQTYQNLSLINTYNRNNSSKWDNFTSQLYTVLNQQVYA